MDNEKNIALIGMPGCFKTTAGKLLAKRLKLNFIDTDELYETRWGEKISATFKLRGEKTFREREKQIVSEACVLKGTVIATGGGSVTDPDSAKLIKDSATVIELCASAETIFDRIKNGRRRPLLKQAGIDEIKELYEKRKATYAACSHMRICTDGLTPSETAGEIIKRLSDEVKNDGTANFGGRPQS